MMAAIVATRISVLIKHPITGWSSRKIMTNTMMASVKNITSTRLTPVVTASVPVETRRVWWCGDGRERD